MRIKNIRLRKVSTDIDRTSENWFCAKNYTVSYSHTGYSYLDSIFSHVFLYLFFHPDEL